jgi:hypothetical protein
MAELLNKGGSFAYLAAGAGALACLVALGLFIALFFAKSKVLRALAFACIALAIATAAVGIIGTLLGRSQVDTAVAHVKASDAERIKRTGYSEVQAILTVALPAAAGATFIALLGFIVASRRRWGEYHEAPPSGAGPAFLLFLFALVGLGVGVEMLRAPLPGRDLDAASWEVIGVSEELDAGKWETCFVNSLKLEPGSAATKLGAHADNQRRCFEHTASGPDPAANLSKLLEQKWIDDAALRDRIAAKIAELKAPPKPVEPPPSEKPPAVDPAIAAVQAAWKPCLDQAAKKKMKIDTVIVVTVASTGKVLEAKEKAPQKKDKVRACALTAAKTVHVASTALHDVEVPFKAAQ